MIKSISNLFKLILYLVFSINPSIINCKKLYFKEDGTFKIIQFTDLHLGYSEESDQLTIEVMHTVVEKEPDADLIVITGDLISGFLGAGQKNWFDRKIQPLIHALQNLQVPYAVTLGNHDDETQLSRRQVAEFFTQQHDEHDNVFTQVGPKNITGATNYFLDVFNHDGNEISTRIWILDSMGKTCNTFEKNQQQKQQQQQQQQYQQQFFTQSTWGCVGDNTLQWMLKKAQNLPSVKNSILFMHIPPIETMYLWNEGVTRGEKGEDVNCPSKNNFFLQKIKQINISQVYFGHDHNNDFEGTFEGVRLGYGKKTGYGGYGPLNDNRGARILVLNSKNLNEPSDSETWIRYQDGEKKFQDLSEKGVGDKQSFCVGPDLVTQMQARGYPVGVFLIGCGGVVFVFVWLFVFRKPTGGKIKKQVKTII